jgi:hypothetical protein
MEALSLMRILRIRNFEKYQHRIKTQNAPWIKLYVKLLCDIDFLKLDVDARYLYIGLLILAAETGNSTVNDPAYLCHRLAIERSRFNLTPLFRSGLLCASERTIRREIEREREKPKKGDGEGDSVVVDKPRPNANRGSIYPDGFEPDERAQSLATSYGLNPHKELAAFRDHHTAKGSVFKDWQAAFRNWLRNSLKFNQRNGHAVSRV